MNRVRASFIVPVAVLALAGLAACGSDTDSVADEISETEDTEAPVATEAPAEEDHDVDDDHVDDDHEDDDHEDDDHDEDRDDEDHDDEDHDDHDDEDHDDHDHDDESGGLDAHVHGAADLTVAWIGDAITIDLVSPTINVFGFEYEPTTDEDIAIEEERTAALTADGILMINDDAGCVLDAPAATEVEHEGSHAEIAVTWQYTCAQPDAISDIDASGLFAEFPGFEDVDAQWISDTEQSAAELTPSASTLTLSS